MQLINDEGDSSVSDLAIEVPIVGAPDEMSCKIIESIKILAMEQDVQLHFYCSGKSINWI